MFPSQRRGQNLVRTLSHLTIVIVLEMRLDIIFNLLKAKSFLFPLNKDDKNDFVVTCCWLHWTADARWQEVDCRFQKMC